MIVDTSALIAVLLDEPERAAFAQLMVADDPRMSAANWFEAAMVADGRKLGGAGSHLDDLVRDLGITIEPVTEAHVRAARIAFRRYGRGSGSPAKLNFGDCLAYALSATSGEPLLFEGDDFTHTDILRVV